MVSIIVFVNSTIGKLRKECDKYLVPIIFLQETPLKDADIILNIWDGCMVINSFFSTTLRGTIMILKGEFAVNSLLIDCNGHYCLTNVFHKMLNDDNVNSLTLVNAYAPNNHKDSITFFQNLFCMIAKFNWRSVRLE